MLATASRTVRDASALRAQRGDVVLAPDDALGRGLRGGGLVDAARR